MKTGVQHLPPLIPVFEQQTNMMSRYILRICSVCNVRNPETVGNITLPVPGHCLLV